MSAVFDSPAIDWGDYKHPLPPLAYGRDSDLMPSARLVGGVLTAEVINSRQQIVDYNRSWRNIARWSRETHLADARSWGVIRADHRQPDVGRLLYIHFDHLRKSVFGIAQVTDDATWSRCESGDLSGFSISFDYFHHNQRPDVVDGQQVTWTVPDILDEVSLVRSPVCPAARFSFLYCRNSRGDGGSWMEPPEPFHS